MYAIPETVVNSNNLLSAFHVTHRRASVRASFEERRSSSKLNYLDFIELDKFIKNVNADMSNAGSILYGEAYLPTSRFLGVALSRPHIVHINGRDIPVTPAFYGAYNDLIEMREATRPLYLEKLKEAETYVSMLRDIQGDAGSVDEKIGAIKRINDGVEEKLKNKEWAQEIYAEYRLGYDAVMEALTPPAPASALGAAVPAAAAAAAAASGGAGSVMVVSVSGEDYITRLKGILTDRALYPNSQAVFSAIAPLRNSAASDRRSGALSEEGHEKFLVEYRKALAGVSYLFTPGYYIEQVKEIESGTKSYAKKLVAIELLHGNALIVSGQAWREEDLAKYNLEYEATKRRITEAKEVADKLLEANVAAAAAAASGGAGVKVPEGPSNPGAAIEMRAMPSRTTPAAGGGGGGGSAVEERPADDVTTMDLAALLSPVAATAASGGAGGTVRKDLVETYTGALDIIANDTSRSAGEKLEAVKLLHESVMDMTDGMGWTEAQISQYGKKYAEVMQPIALAAAEAAAVPAKAVRPVPVAPGAEIEMSAMSSSRAGGAAANRTTMPFAAQHAAGGAGAVGPTGPSKSN